MAMTRSSGLNVGIGIAIAALTAIQNAAAQAPTLSVDPSRLPRLGTIDARFQSYNVEMVEVTGGRLSVTDGPFAESKEMISYAVYDVASKEEAVEWTSRFMKLHQDLWEGWEGAAEIFKALGPEDFAPPA